MSLSERDFYRSRVRPHLSKHGHLSRVENVVEPGFPDINYAIRGEQGLVELKVIRRGKMHFELTQLPWLSKRLRHCRDRGLWVLAIGEEDLVLRLWPASRVVAAPRVRHREWLVVQAADVEPYASWARPHSWDEVAAHLAREVSSPAPRDVY